MNKPATCVVRLCQSGHLAGANQARRRKAVHAARTTATVASVRTSRTY